MIKRLLALLCSASIFTTVQASESFGGIGLVVTETNNGLGVESIVPHTPAAESSLKSGDLIIDIDGKNLSQLDFETKVGMFRDIKNKPIVITYISEGDTIQTTLRRITITTEQVTSLETSAENKKNLEYVTTIELGKEKFYAVYLEKNTIDSPKGHSDLKDKSKRIRLVEIQNNIISYENTLNGKKHSTDLNGKNHNNEVKH